MKDSLRGHQGIVKFMGDTGDQLSQGPHFRILYEMDLCGFQPGFQTLLLGNILEDARSADHLTVLVPEEEE